MAQTRLIKLFTMKGKRQPVMCGKTLHYTIRFCHLLSSTGPGKWGIHCQAGIARWGEDPMWLKSQEGLGPELIPKRGGFLCDQGGGGGSPALPGHLALTNLQTRASFSQRCTLQSLNLCYVKIFILPTF